MWSSFAVNKYLHTAASVGFLFTLEDMELSDRGAMRIIITPKGK